MKKFLLFLISLLIGIGLLYWIINLIGPEKIIEAFLAFSGWHGLLILLLTILILIIGGWRWRVILKSQGNDIPASSIFRYYFAGYSISYLFPLIIFGGDLFRGYLLKERHSIPWAKAIAAALWDRVIEYTIHLAIILIGITLFFSKIGLPPRNMGIILGIVLTFFVTAISFFYFKIFNKQSIVKVFLKIFNHRLSEEPTEVEKEFFKFLKAKRAFLKVIGLSCLKGGAALFRAWVLIIFLGKSLGFFSAFSVLSFSFLATMIPIPTALGVHETFQAFAFNGLGLGVSAAFVFAMIIRAAELIVCLIGIFFLFQIGIGLFKNILLKKFNNFTRYYAD